MSYLHFTSETWIFWRLVLLQGMVYKSLIRCQSFLGKLRMSCEVSFFLPPIPFKIWCHAHIIMRSKIWFKLSNRGATPPHVTRKLAQNTRPSFSHVQGGSGQETRTKHVLHSCVWVWLITKWLWTRCYFLDTNHNPHTQFWPPYKEHNMVYITF